MIEPVTLTPHQHELVDEAITCLVAFRRTGDLHYFVQLGRFYEDLGESILPGCSEPGSGHTTN
jgi:hypothetical protein